MPAEPPPEMVEFGALSGNGGIRNIRHTKEQF